jgi:antitoxin HicB
MASDAIRAYLESLRKDGQPIPPNKKITADPVKEEIKIALEPA